VQQLSSHKLPKSADSNLQEEEQEHQQCYKVSDKHSLDAMQPKMQVNKKPASISTMYYNLQGP